MGHGPGVNGRGLRTAPATNSGRPNSPIAVGFARLSGGQGSAMGNPSVEEGGKPDAAVHASGPSIRWRPAVDLARGGP
jgi:hypothetical protein